MSGKCFTVFKHFWTTHTHTSTNEIWCSYRRMLVNHWHYILLTNNLFVVQHPCFVLYMIAPSITMQCWSNQFILRRFLIVFLAGVGLFFHCKATRCRLLWSVHSHLSIKKTITNSCTNIHYTNRMCTPHRNSNKMVILKSCPRAIPKFTGTGRSKETDKHK